MKQIKTFDMITLDGRLIKPYSNIDLILDLPNPSYTSWGYKGFLDKIDIIIMDENDYFDILNMDITWPYAGKITYLVTKQNEHPDFIPELRLISDKEILPKLLELPSTGNIWLIGENIKYQALVNGLVDEMNVITIPLHVGNDEPMYIRKLSPQKWKVADHEVYENGVLRIVYQRSQS